MKTIALNLGTGIAYDVAKKAAREKAMAGGEKVSLFAWYDRARKMGGPSETCSLEGWKCVRDYAEHHGAEMRISVNDDAFEFFFTKIPGDFVELDRQDSLEIHKDTRRDEFDDVQGG